MITTITNFYLSDSDDRQDELNQCFFYNVQNLAITQMIILLDRKAYDYLEEFCPLLKDKNHVFIIGEGRPSYNLFFEMSDKYSINPIRVLHNLDIQLNISSMHHYNQIKEGEVWALSRWDNGKLFDRRDSQDTWAWRGDMGQLDGADFNIGVAGCDNRIARIFLDNGYKVRNPSKTVQTTHIHKTEYRTYNPKEAVKPPYHFIQPHTLISEKKCRFHSCNAKALDGQVGCIEHNPLIIP